MSGLVPEIVQSLQREAYLLVESCPCSASGELYERKDWRGKLYVSVTENQQIQWSFSGKCRARGGLANYHPGLPLSTHSLAFVNAGADGDYPFLFETGGGVLFYESPRFSPSPGLLPDVSFDITLKFAEYDADRYAEGIPSGLVSAYGSVSESALDSGVPDPEAPEEPPPPEEWSAHPISFYYENPDTLAVSRIVRYTPEAPTLAECEAYFDSLDVGTFWETAADPDSTLPPHPPAYETFVAMSGDPPTFLAAFDHALGWIDDVDPGAGPEPEGNELGYFVWFNPAAPAGPFFYFIHPDTPGDTHRPAAHAGEDIAASYSMWEGWSGPAAELVQSTFDTDALIAAFEWTP